MEYAFNRKALFDYEILEKFEAGLVLAGYEVKSIRAGRLSLAGAYVVLHGEETYLLNANLPPYQAKNTPPGYEPSRSRKLLLHKKEITSLIGQTKQKGLTLVPLRVYNKSGKIKLEFFLARGKKAHDKREKIKQRQFQREKDRVLKGEH
ncbi:MAG: SsrA-binding protein [Parcubacteria group bacterium GW2011_GWA2_42_11]|nr:MAG: SsrA-binding protein [Parcubacteria group bacterium GW2011_GWA2_42_11]